MSYHLRKGKRSTPPELIFFRYEMAAVTDRMFILIWLEQSRTVLFIHGMPHALNREIDFYKNVFRIVSKYSSIGTDCLSRINSWAAFPTSVRNCLFLPVARSEMTSTIV